MRRRPKERTGPDWRPPRTRCDTCGRMVTMTVRETCVPCHAAAHKTDTQEETEETA